MRHRKLYFALCTKFLLFLSANDLLWLWMPDHSWTWKSVFYCTKDFYKCYGPSVRISFYNIGIFTLVPSWLLLYKTNSCSLADCQECSNKTYLLEKKMWTCSNRNTVSVGKMPLYDKVVTQWACSLMPLHYHRIKGINERFFENYSVTFYHGSIQCRPTSIIL